MPKPLVTIVVLNWNGLKDTENCLESIEALDYTNKELVLVDNGSTDGSKIKLPKLLAHINIKSRFVNLPKNTGFTGGNIEALKQANGQYIMLLNNDALVDKNAINEALAVFDNHNNVGAVGGRAYWFDQDNPAYSVTNQFYSYQCIDPWTGEAKTLENDLGIIQEVNNVSGSCVVLKRDALSKIGYFDKRFFAYYEETDLFARMKRSGYKILYDPKFAIWHKVGASTKNRKQMYYYLIFKNQFLFATNNFGSRYYGYFVYRYFRSATAAVFRLLMGKDIVVNRARIKSAMVSGLTIPTALAKRKSLTKQLGSSNYNEMVIREQSPPITVVTCLNDNSQKSLDELSATLESIRQQQPIISDVVVVVPANLVVNSSVKSILSGCRITKNVVAKRSDWHNLGTICAQNPWLLFIEPGQVLNQKVTAELTSCTWKYSHKLVIAFSKSRNGKYVSNYINVFNSLGNAFLIKKSLFTSHGWRIDKRGVSYYDLLLAATKEGKDASRVVSLNLFKPGNTRSLEIKASREQQRQYRNVFSKTKKLTYLATPSFVTKLQRKLYSVLQRLALGIHWILSRDVSIKEKSKKFWGLIKMLIRLRLSGLSNGLQDVSNKQQRNTLAIASMPNEEINISDLPVFINCRDRVKDLKSLIKKMEGFGLNNIFLIDNDSSYPDLLKFYDSTPYQVIRLDRNLGHTAPWDSGAVKILAHDSSYIVSDPDVIPINECPKDAIKYFQSLLVKYPLKNKVGFGLKIDDLPEKYKLKQTVLDWEGQFWKKEIEPQVYEADIDTTFALYRSNLGYILEDSLRTGGLYVARHMPWYQDSDNPTKEEAYYRNHASSVNTWNKESVPERFAQAIQAVTELKG